MNELNELTLVELKEMKSALNELLKSRYMYTGETDKEKAINTMYATIDCNLIRKISNMIDNYKNE